MLLSPCPDQPCAPPQVKCALSCPGQLTRSVFRRWGCTVAECVAQHPKYGPVWKLKYEEKEVEGKKFDAEERQVAFCTSDLLVDLEAEEDGGGGGSKGLMQWRAEGSSHVPPPILPVGQPCQVPFLWRSGGPCCIAVLCVNTPARVS